MTNTNTHKDLLQPEIVSLKQASIGITAVSLVCLLLFASASFFNAARKNRIIAEYTTETHILVENNKDLFRTLFVNMFDVCQQRLENETKSLPKDSYRREFTDCTEAREVLSQINFGDTKDTSSISYIKYKDGKLALLEASSRFNPYRDISQVYQISYETEKKNDLREYFQNNKKINLWDDYMTYIPGKQVIVPIEIDGQRVGYIFRGVIGK